MVTRSNTPVPQPSVERIEDIDVAAEMQGSFLEYAYSVIYSRALPDARDGLKPVQRRILYQMTEMGLRPDRGHVKSARVVGDVMGKLHPHGDASIYDAMVRLTQDFILRVPLIDGHGNFGSLDDGPAAPRYTEARLHSAAMAMTENLDEDVVDFVPNYDNQLTQPSVLPAAFPNLLVNGASGIAVGMATNMAPHNLVEVIAAARHLLDHPEASLEQLMQFVPGPDLPTGGTIVGLDGIRDAYASGRGAFKTRARVVVESITARKTGLIVTELPYLVGPERVIEKIKDGVNARKINGIADVTDLTDRTHGLRLVIGLKAGFSADAVLEQLYRQTPLEDNFSINNVALVDGGPRTLGLRELLSVYLDHRLGVVRRRSEYRLARRRERLHLVEGLMVAILDIDEVIQLIRGSDDSEQARTRLIEVFELSVLQAEYILELRLRRLTRFSRVELETEAGVLRAEIAVLTGLLSDPARIRRLVSSELAEISERFGTPRRTLLTESAGPGETPKSRRGPLAPLEIADTPCLVLLSATGRAVRLEVPSADATGSASRRRSGHDAIRSRVLTTTRTEIGAVTDSGRVIRFTALDLPSVPSNSIQLAAGTIIDDYLSLGSDENVIGLIDLDSPWPIAIGTRGGLVKRILPASYPARPTFDLITLRPDDELVGVSQIPDSGDLIFVASDAQLLRFRASSVRPQGVSAAGMAGITLSPGSSVRFFGGVDGNAAAGRGAESVVVTVSQADDALAGADPGRVKVSALMDYPSKGRATGGVRAHTFLKGESSLAVAWVGASPALASGADGAPRDLPTSRAKRDGSGSIAEAAVSFLGSAI